jgi:hypothetical protein
VFYSTCTHRGRVNSRLLMVWSQIANLTPNLSFCHNLCYICPNGSCEPIFDIYALIASKCYKKRLNARCFDPWNQTLKFQESRWTPKFPFPECECHPPTLPKVGLRHLASSSSSPSFTPSQTTHDMGGEKWSTLRSSITFK